MDITFDNSVWKTKDSIIPEREEHVLGYLISSIKHKDDDVLYVSHCYGMDLCGKLYSPHIESILKYASDGILQNVNALNKLNAKLKGKIQ